MENWTCGRRSLSGWKIGRVEGVVEEKLYLDGNRMEGVGLEGVVAEKLYEEKLDGK